MSLLDDFASAIERDDSTQIESLLTSGSIGVNARLPRDGNPPPLVFAAKRKCPAIVELLLSAGARIDGVDDSGYTACHAAVMGGGVDVMSLLLAHRPNLEIKDKVHTTPLQFSLECRVDDISLMLIEAGASLDDVHQAYLCRFASTSTAAIEALLSRGIVVNQLRDDWGMTPLHMVATRRATPADLGAVVNMLVNVCGVDLKARNSDFASCLLYATHYSSNDAIRCFLNAGATLDDEFVPVLDVVSEYKCAILLLAAGADVNARDGEGQTAWQRRARNVGIDSVLCAFLAAGADQSALDACIFAAVCADQVEAARRDIAEERLDFVRHRALQVCIGLQSLRIDALQMCEILQHSCGPLARLIAFHQWWKIATTVKHFH